MKPGKLDLPIIWRGSDYAPITLTWKDDSGNPINLNGWIPFASSRNVDLHPVITDSAGGVTQISLTNVQTASLKLGVEQWDWIWRDSNTNEILPPHLYGYITIKEPVTRTSSGGGVLQTPSFNPLAGGGYTFPLAVTITSPQGLDVIYTINDGTPSLVHGTRHSSPVVVSLVADPSVLQACATDGVNISGVNTGTYQSQIQTQVLPPTLVPPGGFYTFPIDITFVDPSHDPAILLLYTTNGQDPNWNVDTHYPVPFPILHLTGPGTVKAILALGANRLSPVTTDIYTGTIGAGLAPPSLTPPSGTHPLTVRMICPDPALTLIYTRDNTAPSLTNGTPVPNPTLLAVNTALVLRVVSTNGTNISTEARGQYL